MSRRSREEEVEERQKGHRKSAGAKVTDLRLITVSVVGCVVGICVVLKASGGMVECEKVMAMKGGALTELLVWS